MKTDILYSFRRCPYAIRVRWALLICDIKLELREVDLKNKPLEFLNISSNKTVPVLVKKDGEVKEESLDIIMWALSESKIQNLKKSYITNNKEREIFELITENDYKFKYHLDRFKYSARFNPIHEDYHFSNANRFINKWNKILAKSRWLFGDNPSIADWCIWPFVRQFKIACESQKKTNFFEPPIKEWLDYFEKHQNFEKIMHKYDVWKPSSKKDFFPCN